MYHRSSQPNSGYIYNFLETIFLLYLQKRNHLSSFMKKSTGRDQECLQPIQTISSTGVPDISQLLYLCANVSLILYVQFSTQAQYSQKIMTRQQRERARRCCLCRIDSGDFQDDSVGYMNQFHCLTQVNKPFAQRCNRASGVSMPVLRRAIDLYNYLCY